MALEFLREDFDTVNSEVILESTGAKRYIIEGPCIQTNVLNRNGRKYPGETVTPEIQRYIREILEADMSVGELNHPPKDPRINYERVSHKFESLVQVGNDWIGRAVVARNTPMGSVVAGLMDVGVKMGISSRAVGSTKLMERVKVVQKDFHLISPGDIVSDPSAPDAYLTNLMEGKEWVWANGLLVEHEGEIKKTVNSLAKRKMLNESNLKKLFDHILKQI